MTEIKRRISVMDVEKAITILPNASKWALELDGYVYRADIENQWQANRARQNMAAAIYAWLDKTGLLLLPDDVPLCDQCDNKAGWEIEFYQEVGDEEGFIKLVVCNDCMNNYETMADNMDIFFSKQRQIVCK